MIRVANKAVFSLLTLLSLAACSGENEEEKDMEKPVITDAGITANPIDCQVYRRGDVIPFQYVFQDNKALGSYNIEIHNNFDHHTHGTSATDCPLDAKKAPVKAWVYNQDFSIPAGTKTFTGRQDIRIPADIDAGDYHFMIRLTDATGWQELKAMSIKIVE